jgi:hypothetical protein
MVLVHRPKLVCLQETKMEAISEQVALETLGQSTNGYQVLPTRRKEGGGASCWGGILILLMQPTCH